MQSRLVPTNLCDNVFRSSCSGGRLSSARQKGVRLQKVWWPTARAVVRITKPRNGCGLHATFHSRCVPVVLVPRRILRRLRPRRPLHGRSARMNRALQTASDQVIIGRQPGASGQTLDVWPHWPPVRAPSTAGGAAERRPCVNMPASACCGFVPAHQPSQNPTISPHALWRVQIEMACANFGNGVCNSGRFAHATTPRKMGGGPGVELGM